MVAIRCVPEEETPQRQSPHAFSARTLAADSQFIDAKDRRIEEYAIGHRALRCLKRQPQALAIPAAVQKHIVHLGVPEAAFQPCARALEVRRATLEQPQRLAEDRAVERQIGLTG